jgi:hypothetical protein
VRGPARRGRLVAGLAIGICALAGGLWIWNPWESGTPVVGPSLRPAARAPLPAPEAVPATGAALVGETAQSAAYVSTNAEIAPGMFLREVYPGYVVIEHDGVRQVLTIAPRGPGGGYLAGASQRGPLPEPPAVGMHDSVRVAAAAPTEAVQGIRVFSGRNRNGLALLGLHPGDLVTEIDGAPVAGLQTPDIVGMIQDGTATSATVFRAGRLQHIDLHAAVTKVYDGQRAPTTDGSAADSAATSP